MKTILITGAYGQLGSEIKILASRFPQFNYLFTDSDTLDITNQKQIENFFSNIPIHYIINCAAYTAVDKAESEPHLAELINATAVYYLTQIAIKYNIRLIHISTDYVFDGKNTTPYKETDAVNPISVYGKTKLAGEQFIINSNLNAIIIRLSWLYSSFGNNFVKTLLRLSQQHKQLNIVNDQVGTPTYAADAAYAIMTIITKSENNTEYYKPGIYHYSNQGMCSWYEFAQAIFTFSNRLITINPITTQQYPTPAQRPAYSILDKTKFLNTFNIPIPHWKDSLKQCIEKLKNSN